METKEQSIDNEMKQKSSLGGYRGLIFDLDGTLIDSVQDICAFVNRKLAEYNYPTHTVDKYIDWIGDGARKLVERAAPKDIDSSTFEKLFAEYLHIYECDEHTESVLYDGIPELLDRLNANGIPMAILTNKPHKVMLTTIEAYFKKWDFVVVQGREEGKPNKPDPIAALQIAEVMQLAPEDIVFVGDSAVDVNTGNSAGMTSICIMCGYETRENILEAKPDIMVEKHSELLELL